MAESICAKKRAEASAGKGKLGGGGETGDTIGRNRD